MKFEEFGVYRMLFDPPVYMFFWGNLGFWCTLVSVVVGWLVCRWKWRRVASRREEIKRLMMLASEEAARAELEAASGYKTYGWALAPEAVTEEPVVEQGPSPVQQLQHHCEVCFNPTATRCKQCKSVRYCSKKCQIFHWRQGHKDECRIVTNHQYIDPSFHSRLKEFNPDEVETVQDGIQVMLNTKPVESSSDKLMFSNPILYVPGENNDPETTTKDNRKQTDVNVKSLHLPGENSSPAISTYMSVASDTILKAGDKCDGQFLSEKSGFTNPKSGCIDVDEKPESSSSSDSEKHSLSEPSTSSDFWANTIEPKKHYVNALEFNDAKKSNSCSSTLPSLGGKTNVRVEMLDSDVNRVQTVNPRPDTLMPKQSLALPEVSEDGLNAKEPVLNRKLPGQNGLSSKEDAKLPSTVSHEPLFKEWYVPSKHVDNFSSLQSLAPKVVDQQVDGTNDVLDALKIQRMDYSSRQKYSVAHLSSIASTKKTTTIPDAQSVENKGTCDDASRSLDRSSYVRVVTNGTNPSARRVVDELKASSFSRPGSLGAGSWIMGRYEGSFPYELFVKLYNWNKVALRPSGLKNCGNSCYANAVLQCLAFTPPLTAYFLQGLHTNTCHKKEWCFTCELEALVKKTKEGNYPLSPARLLSQMQHVASHLGNGREEDAHEFLRYAIDAMQLVCLEDAAVNLPSSLDDEDTTLLGLTFGGYLQSKIECMRCGGISKQHERIMDLTIEIGGEIGSLEDALRQFTRSEILDGENKYRCGRCKSYERAKKKLRVHEAPNVLTVALKRFQSGEFGKLNKSVKFPEVLNLATYMRGTSDKSPIYQLYGAVVHLDVKNATFTGHYVCYVKNNQGKWFKADDSLVQSVELEKVLSNDAYMLFYARCSPRAPKPIRSSLIPLDLRKSSKNLTSKFIFHPSEPWDLSQSDLKNRTSTSGRTSSSSNSEDEHPSSFFSETGSHGTESSSRESTSTDESMFDHRDMDSDTSSPSSSVLSPVRSRHVQLARSSDAKIDGDGFWGRTSSKVNSCRTNDSGNMNGVYVGRSMK